MNEITCPHCGTAFKVDEAAYADILKQVHDSEFEHQLHERLELAEKDKLSAIELAKNELSREMQKAAAAKDAEIQKLKANLDAGEVERKLAVAEALRTVEKNRDELANELQQMKQDHQAAAKLAEAELAANEITQRLAITEAVSAVQKERDELKSNLERAQLEKQLADAKGAAEGAMLREEVTQDDIASIVSRWTGIPVDKMLEGEREKLLQMEAELGQRVIGQADAVRAVSTAVRRARAGLQPGALERIDGRLIEALVHGEIAAIAKNGEDAVQAWLLARFAKEE